MSKVGEFPIDRSDGTRDWIALHEPGTFDEDPVLLQASNGNWGTPYLVPIGDGDTGLLVQKSDGTWLQFNREGILVLEDWEQGYRDTDTWNWTDTDFSGSADVTSDYAHRGTYSLRFNDYFKTAALQEYPEPLPNLPVEQGDTVEYTFYMPSPGDIDSGQQYWFAVLLQDAPHHTTTASGNQDWDNMYTFEAITGSNDLWRVQKRINGDVVNYTTEGDEYVDWQADQWYKGEIQIRDTDLRGDIYEWHGSGWANQGYVVTPDLEWLSGGVGMRGSGDGTVIWGDSRILP